MVSRIGGLNRSLWVRHKYHNRQASLKKVNQGSHEGDSCYVTFESKRAPTLITKPQERDMGTKTENKEICAQTFGASTKVPVK